MDLPLSPPIEPMLAELSRDLPVGELLYEPKWDGLRCLVFRDGDDIELQSRGRRSLTRYFPELLGPLRAQLPRQVVLDGELVVPRHRGIDVDAINDRIHPAASRVERLSRETPARFIASDVLACGSDDCTGVALRDRRDRLEGMLADAEAPLHLTPATTDPAVARDWLDRFEGAGLDGIIAKELDGVYEPGKRTLLEVKHKRTADVVVAGFRWHEDGQGVGSLMLGLYDADGRLRHVGVASSFSAARRRELVAELDRYREGAEAGHPWLETERATDATPRSEDRWNARKDTSWEPLRVELVAEVAYEHLQGDRFRHAAHFERWRKDHEPRACTYAQLERPVPIELTQVLRA